MRTKYNDIDKANLAYRSTPNIPKVLHQKDDNETCLQCWDTEKLADRCAIHPDEELLNYKQLDMLETVSKGISSAEEPLQEW